MFLLSFLLLVWCWVLVPSPMIWFCLCRGACFWRRLSTLFRRLLLLWGWVLRFWVSFLKWLFVLWFWRWFSLRNRRYKFQHAFLISLILRVWLLCSRWCRGRILFVFRLRVFLVVSGFYGVFGWSRGWRRVCFLGRLCWLGGRLRLWSCRCGRRQR